MFDTTNQKEFNWLTTLNTKKFWNIGSKFDQTGRNERISINTTEKQGQCRKHDSIVVTLKEKT